MAEFKIIQMYNSTGDAIFPKTKAQVVDYIPENGTATTVAAELASLRKDLTTAAAGGITSIKVGETSHTAADNSTAVDLTTAINGLIASNIHMNVEVVTELPVSATEKDLGKIILIADDKSAAGTYIEYIAVKTSADDVEPATYAWEQIGTTAVDLTGYATETYVGEAIKDKVNELGLDKLGETYAAKSYEKTIDDHIADGDIHVTTADKGRWDGKQDALTEAQLAAANSGITAAKVGAYDAYVAVERYSKTDAEAMAEGKASAAIEALDLPNTYAAKSATEQHIADTDIHVNADQVAAIANVANKADKTIAVNDKTLSVLYFEEVTA